MPFEVSPSRQAKLQRSGRKCAGQGRPPSRARAFGKPGQPTPLDTGGAAEDEAEIGGQAQAALESLAAFLMVFLAGLAAAAFFPL